MKKELLIWIISGVLFVGLTACAVTRTPQDIMMDQALHEQAAEAVRSNEFVLEADRLEFRRGGIADVTGNTNFISLHNDQVTIQTAFNNGWSGANNLGGITFEGRPSDLKISTDRQGNLTVTFNSTGSVFSGRIEMTLFAGSNEATATVYPTFSGNRLTLNGVVIPADESQVFKGRAF